MCQVPLAYCEFTRLCEQQLTVSTDMMSRPIVSVEAGMQQTSAS
jgi:hypothetical protein